MELKPSCKQLNVFSPVDHKTCQTSLPPLWIHSWAYNFSIFYWDLIKTYFKAAHNYEVENFNFQTLLKYKNKQKKLLALLQCWGRAIFTELKYLITERQICLISISGFCPKRCVKLFYIASHFFTFKNFFIHVTDSIFFHKL